MFRKEVAKANQQRLYGRVSLTQPISIYASATLIIFIFIIVIIYLSQASFSRKEVVKGYLLPGKGVVKVFAHRSGVIGKFYVEEGDTVQKGDNLFKIKNSQNLTTGIELSVALIKELELQIKHLKNELNANNEMFNKEYRRIIEQKEQLSRRLTLINESISTNNIKLSIKEKKKERNNKLFENGYISTIQYNESEEEYLEVLEEKNELKRELAQTNIEISILETKQLELPERKVINKMSIERKISELNSQIINLKSQLEFIEKAPESGVITAIQPIEGSKVDISTPLLSILPIGSPLEIELLLPTRSAGFIEIGNKVNIRFDAFPYQKFGFITGVISNIDKVLVLPSEKVIPIQLDEAMYRVRAKLNQQSIKAYGKEFPLKVGMIADADIILEKRVLLEWLLDPIYAVKGRFE
ncbi:HlyD family secretion protein [Vibrio aestuarianus]|uniref:HlyD family secretion protein n=1 Tax=Vibrio aestuarianus TaxID=28171 RepID=UPI00237C6DB0|nr:HlyD family efflux transporter periplasmic adaptor subunit [Vibrio aestuarianus]MDE1329478.1 HlyD family secretion protein [Vibrio aestuarianus]